MYKIFFNLILFFFASSSASYGEDPFIKTYQESINQFANALASDQLLRSYLINNEPYNYIGKKAEDISLEELNSYRLNYCNSMFNKWGTFSLLDPKLASYCRIITRN